MQIMIFYFNMLLLSFQWKKKKSKLASKFWYIYGSVIFLSFGVFFVIFPTASLVASPLESLHRSEREKERSCDSVRQYPAVPSVHPLCLTVVDLLCQGALLPVPPFTPLPPPCFLSVHWWAGPVVVGGACGGGERE